MSKLNIVVFGLLGLISACVGQGVIQAGQCDLSVAVVNNFDASAYLGVWYDIESFPSSFQTGTCNTATYTLAADGAINVQNSQNVNGVIQFAEGRATAQTGAGSSAKFDVIFGSSTTAVPYWVLDTDYDTFALVYSCVNEGTNSRRINSWKLARNRDPLPAAATARINAAIARVEALSTAASEYRQRDHTQGSCFVDYEGACPTVAGVVNFNVNNYLGTWLEVARYPQNAQTGQCNRARYEAAATAEAATVENSQVTNEDLSTITGQAVTVTGQSGVLQVTLNIAGVPTVQNLIVLATDYNNYALVYSCSPLANGRYRVGSWQLRKTLEPLSTEAKTAINNAISSTPGLQPGFYYTTSQDNAACFYYPPVSQLPNPIELPGPCDTSITGLADFNVNRYLGTWIEEARYPQTSQTGQCSRATYGTGATTGVFTVENRQVTNEALQTISGQATATAQPGMLAVTFNIGGVPTTQNLYILATDYDSYALLYTCSNIDGNRRRVGSWKLRRNLDTPLTTEATNNINAVITRTQGLREEYYQPTSQDNAACFYYPPVSQLPNLIELPGPCDTSITGLADFNVNRYLGTWIEEARYPQTSQTGQCSRATYGTGATTGIITVENIQVTNEALQTISGQATAIAQPGVLAVTFNINGMPTTQNLYILATDYDSYALLYTCSNIDGNRRRVGSWKLRRNLDTPLTTEATNNINAVITRTQGLREEYYRPTSQDNAACFYYPPVSQLPNLIELPGPCDTSITGLADFNVNRYLGTWIEEARYPQTSQTGQCSRATYGTGATSGVFTVENKQVTNEALQTISGQATATAQPGVLAVIFNIGGVPTTQNLYILATDYDSYALLYTCSNIDGNRRRVGSWKLRRNLDTPLTTEATNNINAVITRTQGLREEYYRPTSQDNAACFYYPPVSQLPNVIELPGPCDTSITGLADFNVNRYLGTWIEEARYPQTSQTGQCNRATYGTGATSGVFTVENKQVTNEALQTISGQATATAQSGVLAVTFNIGGVPTTQNLYVLATDYDSYALLYTCANIDGNRRRVGSWKLRRNLDTPLTTEATNNINAVITRTQGLREEYYRPTSQDNAACFYYPPVSQLPNLIELPGPCDTSITGLADFNVNRYLGTWIEEARYPQTSQTGQCNRATYRTGATSGVFTVENRQVTNEALRTISGQATSTAQPGVLAVTFNIGGVPTTQNLYILATDYDSYALLYTCSNIDGNRRRVGSWKLRRNLDSPLTTEATNNINAVITRTQGLREEYYRPTSQDNAACFYYPPVDELPVSIILPGPCNTSITGVANFDANKYLGTWLEVARYPQNAQTQPGQCVRATYGQGATAGVFTVQNRQVVNEELLTIIGEARPTEQSGVLEVTFNINNQPTNQNIYVLATDYDNYALMYTCTNVVGNQRQVGSWKLRRNLVELSETANNAINSIISATQGLKEEYYQDTLQTANACFYYPTQTGNEEKVLIPGQCDATISGVASFNMTRFTNSVWYQIRRYDAVGNRSCIGTRMTRNGDNIDVNFVEVIGQEVRRVEAIARLETSKAGKFVVTFSDSQQYAEFYILATDYDNYAIAYNCTNEGAGQRHVGAWLLSRTRTWPAAGTIALNALIAARQEITNRAGYFKDVTHNDDCPEPSSAFLLRSSIIVIFVCTVLQLVW